MADKRKLLLEVDVDVDSKPLKQLGDDAQHAEDGFDDLNHGLKRLDQQYESTTQRITDLRKEIKQSGDLDLVKDLRKAENDLKKIGRDRKSILGGAEIGAQAASEVSTELVGRLGPLLARAPIGPVGAVLGAGILAGALPVIGGGIAAGIIGAGGGIGLVGGIALAARDERVKSAASSLSKFIGDELTEAAQPLVPAIMASLASVRQQFLPLRQDIAQIFSASSGLLRPLTDGALAGITRVVMGIKDLVTSTDGAGPVFAEFGHLAAEVGDAVGDVFTQLSDNGDEAAAAIRLLGNVLTGTIRFVGEFVDVASDAIRPLLDIALASANVTAAMYGWVPVFGDYIKDGRDNLIDIKSALDQTGGAAFAAAEGAKALTGESAALNAELRNVNINLATQIGYYNQIRGQNLSAAEAQLAYKDAIDQAKGSLEKKNVVTSGEEKALLRAVSAANQNVEALEKTGAASDVTSSKFNSQRDSLLKLAERMGMNSVEARKYIDRLLQIPTNVNTKIAMTGIPTALGDLNILKNKIDALPTYKKFRYIVEQNQVTIRTDAGGKKALAGGGPMRAGETYLVGEEGPELVTPTQNGYVHDAKATAAMASSAGPGSVKARASSAPVYVTVNAGYVVTPAQLEAIIGKTVNTIIRKGKLDAVNA